MSKQINLENQDDDIICLPKVYNIQLYIVYKYDLMKY